MMLDMPYRRYPIATGEIYHVFNRSVGGQPIFLSLKDYNRALEVVNFYKYLTPGLRFSYYKRLPIEQREQFLSSLVKDGKKQVKLFVFCLMPNHIHFLLQEQERSGISNFMRNFQNSYAKYFNIKTERSGALFQAMFKAVRIETDEQLLHVCRYIHLNPLTSFVLKDITGLESYEWSSYIDYLDLRNMDIVDTHQILQYFSSVGEFKSFTADQTDYQRKLRQIKHLIIE